MSAARDGDPAGTFWGLVLLGWVTVAVLVLYTFAPPWVREGMLLLALGLTTAGLGTALLHAPRP